ncbi:MAG: acetolactate synthase small subunit [Chloroflexi bacterium]|nr:acetolactate synthase small subunit [Chloroflexota bacterium]
MSTHTIVALVENRPGVLNRIVSKWRQRGFNIESLAVGHSEVPGLSRMTFTVDGTTTDIDQVTKQMYKVIEVVKIADLTEHDMVHRELAMVKVTAPPKERGGIMEIVDIFRAKIVDVATESLIIEVTGTEEKVDAFLEMVRPYGIKELVRTGRIAMARGGATPMAVEGATGEQHRYRPAGEGKAKVGTLI